MSGQKALSMLEERVIEVNNGLKQMYKLVLLDFSMPEMDGP